MGSAGVPRPGHLHPLCTHLCSGLLCRKPWARGQERGRQERLRQRRRETKLDLAGILSLHPHGQRRKLKPREDSSWLKVTGTVQRGWQRTPLYNARGVPSGAEHAQTQPGGQASGWVGRRTWRTAQGPAFGACSLWSLTNSMGPLFPTKALALQLGLESLGSCVRRDWRSDSVKLLVHRWH